MSKLIHKILCLFDEHTPKEEWEKEEGLYPNTIRHYKRCKYCNKRIVKGRYSWFAVRDEWLRG